MEEHYVYYFTNKDDEVVYIGLTNNIHNRMNQHFRGNGHLTKEQYDSIKEVHYSILNSRNEASLYERYFISKAKPPYNQAMKKGGGVEFLMPHLQFKNMKTEEKSNHLDGYSTDKIYSSRTIANSELVRGFSITVVQENEANGVDYYTEKENKFLMRNLHEFDNDISRITKERMDALVGFLNRTESQIISQLEILTNKIYAKELF